MVSPEAEPPGGAGDRLVIVGEELHRFPFLSRAGWN